MYIIETWIIYFSKGKQNPFGFDPNSKINKKKILELSKYINAWSGCSVILNGHCSTEGGEKFNLGLSKKRAVAVKNYLIKNHYINESKIIVKAHGELSVAVSEKNLSKTELENARNLNRRVEINLIADSVSNNVNELDKKLVEKVIRNHIKGIVNLLNRSKRYGFDNRLKRFETGILQYDRNQMEVYLDNVYEVDDTKVQIEGLNDGLQSLQGIIKKHGGSIYNEFLKDHDRLSNGERNIRNHKRRLEHIESRNREWHEKLKNEKRPEYKEKFKEMINAINDEKIGLLKMIIDELSQMNRK